VRYTHCEEGAEVEFYTVYGGGHTWPGGSGIPEWIAGPTTQAIDASEMMWEFFTRMSEGG